MKKVKYFPAYTEKNVFYFTSVCLCLSLFSIFLARVVKTLHQIHQIARKALNLLAFSLVKELVKYGEKSAVLVGSRNVTSVLVQKVLDVCKVYDVYY